MDPLPYLQPSASPSQPPSAPQELTRFSFVLMDRRVSLTYLHTVTDIPKPTLSMYKTGRRPISISHRPLLAIALNVPIAALVGYVDKEVVILPTPDPEPTPEPPDEPSHPPIPTGPDGT